MPSTKFTNIKAAIVSSYDETKSSSYNEGGQVRTNLHYNILKKYGVDLKVIDLTDWKKHLFRILRQLSCVINENRTILVMTGPNGSRTILPLISHLLKNKDNKLIYVPIGVGALTKIIEREKPEAWKDFPYTKFGNNKDLIMKSSLKRCNSILLENNFLIQSYENFYQLKNCHRLINYRERPTLVNTQLFKNITKGDLLFFGRISQPKGIFVLLDALKILKKKNIEPQVDLYGRIDMTEEERKVFDAALSDKFIYHGIANQKDKYQILSAHKFFILPTYWEGVPGAWVESLLAGVPSIMTRYPVAEELITNGKEGYLVDVGNAQQLADAIEKALFHTNYEEMQKNVLTLSKQYILEENEEYLVASLLGITD